MAAQEHHLRVQRTARYYQLGTPGPTTRRVWVVCHGYGQLAAYFIRHFAFLTEDDPNTVVLAPEGLSRFYLQGTNGRVGSTWMTREDRLTEIEDYVAYLNQLSDTILAQCAPDAQVLVLGFSQGAATVSRWLAHAPFRAARLVLWAGAFPPDMDLSVAARLLRQVPVTLVCGTQDEYVTDEAVAQQQEALHGLGVEPEIIWFEGRHQLDRVVLQQLREALEH
ncbi:phospholipase [Hymenobacter sp. NBH84]|uniref:alpha/beta hydrolase n=1 Tax=Hymenobacter sp. NBH84 TaxID=2596915 RepID=UPI0016251C94|nr:alpha/beta hydrolase [Hymenobacter sp. NBH84]QNE39122.1 phospholipase [Hymenobacter sp. NBH84]